MNRFPTKHALVPISEFDESLQNTVVRDRHSNTVKMMVDTYYMLLKMVCLVAFYTHGVNSKFRPSIGLNLIKALIEAIPNPSDGYMRISVIRVPILTRTNHT